MNKKPKTPPKPKKLSLIEGGVAGSHHLVEKARKIRREQNV